LELEESLPDYCPDIARLIRVDCSPVIENSEFSGDRCVVSGKAVCRILYETDYKSKIKSAEFVKDFSHSFEVPMQGCTDPVAQAKARCTHISCKMLSPRKFIIKSRLQLDLDVFANTAVKTVDTRSGDNTFYRTVDISYEKKLPPCVEEFAFEEELPLLQSEKSIGDIVFGSVQLQPPQVTVSGSDAIVKTNATVKLLYEEEGGDNQLVATTKVVPVSMTLSNLAVDDAGRIAVSLSVTNARVTSELDAYGENRIIKATFTARAKAEMTEKVTETVATDLFSSDCVNKTESATIALPAQNNETDRTFSIDTVITPEKPFVNTPFDIDIIINDLKAEIANGGVNLSGNYTVTMLGHTADSLESYDSTGEFMEFIPIELSENVTSVDAELYPFDYSLTMMSDGSIAIRIILNAKIKTYSEELQTIVTSVISQEPLPKEKDSYAVIYYFPNASDNLWSIAKRYYANPSVIKNANPNAFDEYEQVKSGTKMIMIKK